MSNCSIEFCKWIYTINENKKEREVYAIGRPSIENLTPNERKAFFSTLLMSVIEHFKDDESDDKKRQIGIACNLYKILIPFARTLMSSLQKT